MDKPENEKSELLKNNILAQTKYYLEDANEFFPFGAVIDKNDRLKPISIYSEKDIPDSQVLHDQLKVALKKGLKNGDYLIAAIAIDVYINNSLNNEISKRTGVQITFHYSNANESASIYLYHKNEDGYSFEYYDTV